MAERLLVTGIDAGVGVSFARAKVRQLRVLGLNNISKAYKFKGYTVFVRINGPDEIIWVAGGVPLLSGFVAEGFVSAYLVDTDGVDRGAPAQDAAVPDGWQLKYRMPRFWPRSDFRPKSSSGWLTTDKLNGKLAKLDMTFNGTSFRQGKIPYPDARAPEYGKRAPASLYSGAMRKVVQVLLGLCEGEPRAITTDPDNLSYGFNNIDIPYSYNADKSHGVFVCSDHSPEKPNIWVIELSAAKGCVAWKMDTKKVSEKTDPDLYSALGFMPIATPRPKPSDKDTKYMRTIQLGGGLSDYFGHQALYPECGWAFSYSGHKAANVSFEYNFTESGVRLLSVWAHLWEIGFTETEVGVASGGTIKGPSSLQVVRHERERVKRDVNIDVKRPGFTPDVGRTLISETFGGAQRDPYTGDIQFPVYAFYGHNSEELKVFSYRPSSQQEPDQPEQDQRAILNASDFRRSWAGPQLRFGQKWLAKGGGFVGPDMPDIVDGTVFMGTETSYALGAEGPINGPYPGRLWGKKQRVKRTSYRLREEIGRTHGLMIPFGDREVLFSFYIDIKSITRWEPTVTAHWGIDIAMFDATLSDVYDGQTYLGTNIDIVPSIYPPPEDPGLTGGAAWFPGPGQYFQPVGGSFEGLLDPSQYPGGATLVPEVAASENEFPKAMKLVTSKLVVDVPTYGYIYVDPDAPPEGPYNLEQFGIPGDTMSNRLLDATSEAFTGAVVASEGEYRGAKYDTFVASGEGEYPVTEIDFRFGYWVGVPFKGETA